MINFFYILNDINSIFSIYNCSFLYFEFLYLRIQYFLFVCTEHRTFRVEKIHLFYFGSFKTV